MVVDRIFRPHPLLAPYVKLIWVLETDLVHFAEGETVVPDGIVELVFHFGEPLTTFYPESAGEVQPRSFAISQTKRPIRIVPAARTGLLSIRFFPWGAHHFFDLPVSEFSDRIIPAERLWRVEAECVLEQINLAPDNQTRVEIAERFLLGQLLKRRRENLEPAVRLIWTRRGRITVRELGCRLGWTERQLQRRFRVGLGASPKLMIRITRFLHASRLLREGCWRSLADVAYECGYHDQAHFIRDFQSFSGMTPRTFLEFGPVSCLDLD